MGDVVHHVESCDVLFAQEVHRLRVLLAEDRHQNVDPGHLLLSRRLDVQDGTLQHALEGQRGLSLTVIVQGQQRRSLLEEALEVLAQPLQIGPAGLQYLGRRRVVR